MSHARIASATLLALGLLACSRELELPAQPPPEPASLGSLSGLYRLHLVAVDADHGGEILLPLRGLLSVLHLEDPEGGDDPILAAAPDADLATLPWIFHAAYDGVTIDGLANNRVPFTARAALGGGAIAFDVEVPVCGGGEGYPLRATRACPFDPSLSGVYAGVLESGEDVYLTVSVSGSELVAMFYPRTTRVFVSEDFDRFAGAGSAGVIDLAELDPNEDAEDFQESARYEIYDDGDELNLVVEVLAPDGSVRERLHVTRKAGGEASDCAPPETPPGALVPIVRHGTLPGTDYFDLELAPADRPEERLTAGEHVEIAAFARSPGDEQALEGTSEGLPAGVAYRFGLPAAPVEPLRFELVAGATVTVGDEQQLFPAIPACLTWDGQILSQ